VLDEFELPLGHVPQGELSGAQRGLVLRAELVDVGADHVQPSDGTEDFFVQ